MKKIKETTAKMIQTLSERFTKTAVGKSSFIGIYEIEIPNEIECWIKEDKLRLQKKGDDSNGYFMEN